MKDKVNWKTFQQVFLRHYFPESICDQKEQEFMLLKQVGRDLAQYDQEFNRLMRFGPGQVSTEKDRIKKFRNGMKFSLQTVLATHKFETYSDLLDTALTLERAQKQ